MGGKKKRQFGKGSYGKPAKIEVRNVKIFWVCFFNPEYFQIIESDFKKYVKQHNLQAMFSELVALCFENGAEDPKRFIVNHLSQSTDMELNEHKELQEDITQLQEKKTRLKLRIATIKSEQEKTLQESMASVEQESMTSVDQESVLESKNETSSDLKSDSFSLLELPDTSIAFQDNDSCSCEAKALDPSANEIVTIDSSDTEEALLFQQMKKSGRKSTLITSSSDECIDGKSFIKQSNVNQKPQKSVLKKTRLAKKKRERKQFISDHGFNKTM